MDLTEGIIAMFAIVFAMVTFIGSIMLIKGAVNKYLSRDPIERWKQRT